MISHHTQASILLLLPVMDGIKCHRYISGGHRGKSHKVIATEHVTKYDALVSQHHEVIGTERIYALEQQEIPVFTGITYSD